MRRRHRRRHPVLTAIGLGLLLPPAWVAAHCPSRIALWLGRRLGDLAWMLLPRRRAVTLDNLARVFAQERPTADLRRLGRRSFEHLGMNLIEGCVFFFRSQSVMRARLELTGVEHLDHAVRRSPKGALVLTAHYGNWELLSAIPMLSDFSFSVVVRPLDEPLMDRLMERFRRRNGVEVISKRRGLREVLDALRRGGVVAILLDQNASRGEGVFAPFFGIPASTSKSLAVISLRTGTPVVPAFIRRLPDGRHRVEVQPEIPPPADRSVASYTAAFNRSIEQNIRKAPEQWFWMHRRWRTQPERESA
jgi:Kdo2-lipid IVA lauroyltransferase/acyltransferase